MDTPATRPSLIVRLADREDAEAWQMFQAIYGPLLERVLNQWGLQEADRQEVIQEVLAAVAHSVDRFRVQEHAGAFRGWLARIARNKMADLLKDRGRFPRAEGGSGFQKWLNQHAAEDESLSRWDIEHRRAVFAWAAEQVRRKVHERTWLAFQWTAIDGQTPVEVAQRLGVAVGWVYVARSRVLSRLREWVSQTGEIELAPGSDSRHAM